MVAYLGAFGGSAGLFHQAQGDLAIRTVGFVAPHNAATPMSQ